MKKKIILILMLCLFFINIDLVKADKYVDYNGSSAGSLGALGSGEWNIYRVGIKMSIVSSNGTFKESVIILNKNGSINSLYFSADRRAKLVQSTNITWVKSSQTPYVTSNLLPSQWTTNNVIFDFNNFLSKNSYSNLKTYLQSYFTTLKPGDYILVEPMAEINKLYGTAFELGNAALKVSCENYTDYCKSYSGPIFGYSGWKSGGTITGGIFWHSIFLTSNVPSLGMTVYSGDPSNNQVQIRDSRNACFFSNTCGRGIGVYKYEDLFTGSIRINKYKSGTNSTINGAGFTLYSDSSCTNKIKDQVITQNGSVFFDKLNTGTYYYKETLVPSGYTGDSNCRGVYVTDGQQSTVSAYNAAIPTTGSLRINIKIKNTNTLITSPNSQARFKVYKGANCSGTLVNTVTTSSGYKDFAKLDAGTYSIEEITHPNGYIASGNKCVKPYVFIVADKPTTEDIFYEQSCDSELSALGANPSASSLFALYQKYPSKNGLLNLSSPSCSVVNCNKELNASSCLTANYSTTFNDNNLSCYNESFTDAYGNYTGFCYNSFKLTNNIGTNNFYAASGQFLIKQNENTISIYKKQNLEERIINTKFIATATSSKTCYMLNSTPTTTLNSYSVRFGDNDLNGIADKLDYDSTNIWVSNPTYTSKGLAKYTISQTNSYKLNTVCLSKITGRVVDCDSSSMSQLSVKGLISSFSPSTISTSYTTESSGNIISLSAYKGTIPFFVSYGSDSIDSDVCTYETIPRIITYDKDDSGSLDLEFRIIDTLNPFTRTPNTNWQDGNDKSTTNKVITENIIDAPSSYSTSPLYSITLTPSDITAIREYNKLHPYDDYEVEKVKGKNIIRNSFLLSLESGKVGTYTLTHSLINNTLDS